MVLVIAEKPSVAGEIAKVLGASKREQGYHSGNGYYVSWCVGHLIELAEPQHYDPAFEKWSLDTLPIMPSHFSTSVVSGTRQQYDVLRELCNRNDVTELVCATDAGREGELIFRLVYEKIGSKKPCKRLWISSMETTAIQQGFQQLSPLSEYDNLYYAARCRQKADWLVGMNATRLFSVIHGVTLKVGRVQTPTLSFIVEREKNITGFVKEPFYVVELNCNSFSVSGAKLKDKQAATVIRETCDGKTAIITSVQRQEKKNLPPKLYDLTTLQREANRMFGYTAQQTLDTVQSLYEKKLATYPRTDSRYLTTDMADGVPELVHRSASMLSFNIVQPIKCDIAKVIDNSKVTDHHAIIPTLSVSSVDLTRLTDPEQSILRMLAVRLICAVAEAHVYSEVVVTVDCEGNSFSSKGKTVVHQGWKGIEQSFLATLRDKPKDNSVDTEIPDVSEGQSFTVKADIHEGFTSPPKHYTEDTLLSAMETAGRTIEDESLKEAIQGSGLGTPATRANIIENIIKSGYAERNGNSLIPTTKAVTFMGIIDERIKSAELTAEWEKQLEDISKGILTEDVFMANIQSFISSFVDTIKHNPQTNSAFTSDKTPLGACPRCKKHVVEQKMSYSCESGKGGCGFVIWKTIASVPIPQGQAEKLLAKGKTDLIKGFEGKSGKVFDAYLVFDKDRNVIFAFPNSASKGHGGKPARQRFDSSKYTPEEINKMLDKLTGRG